MIVIKNLNEVSTLDFNHNEDNQCFYFVSITCTSCLLIKAASSVTFDLLILKIMFLFFKNTVIILKFR